jgi:hypothetical protein
MTPGPWIRSRLERLVYVIAGLPIAIRGPSLAPSPAAREIRTAFAQRYWRPSSAGEAGNLIVGILLAPVAVPLAALWFTARDGRAIRKREGRGLAAQLFEQLRLYGRAGVVGPWYYILSLYRDGARRAPTFLQRCETKHGIYELLSDGPCEMLADKQLFAERCAAANIPCAGCEIAAGGNLPDCDLFVKPRRGRGGRGAERWDRVAPRRWSDGKHELGPDAFIAHLRGKPTPQIIQRRVQVHPALEALTSGAVPTVRVLTILDEQGEPEVVATVFRMSIGANRTVDNIHAGGLACSVSLDDGVLAKASNLGADATLGWVSHHPTTGARIEGTRLPSWDEVKQLAVRAHRAFKPRLLVGWDIAISENGPVLIEGNRGPDMDLMQRFMDVGFCADGHRFGELLAHYLRVRRTTEPVQRMPRRDARNSLQPDAIAPVDG